MIFGLLKGNLPVIILGALILSVFGWYEVRTRSLESDISVLRAEKAAMLATEALRSAEISALSSAIEQQSEKIAEYARITEEQKARAHRANLELGEVRAREQDVLRRLRLVEGESCEQAIKLLDQELDLR